MDDCKDATTLTELIATLMKKSARKRAEQGAECTLLIRGRKLHLVELDPMNAEMLIRVHALLEQSFSVAELDPLDRFIECVQGVAFNGSGKIQYRVFIAQDVASGEIVSAYVWGLAQLRDSSNKKTDELMCLGFFAATVPGLRRNGLNRELYLSALIAARDAALEQKRTIVVVAGEVTTAAEVSWNKLGRQRVYLRMKGDVLSETAYIQPSLLFDPRTGLPSGEDDGGVGEHLMVQLFEPYAEHPDPKILASIVRTFSWWTEQQITPILQTDTARKVCLRTMHALRDMCLKFIEGSEARDVILLEKKGREQLREEGILFLTPDYH